jgi:hypothetical protein
MLGTALPDGWIDLPETILRPGLQALRLSWDEFVVMRAFNPEGMSRRGKLLNGQRVAHYTSVAAAIDIATGNAIWMRNARYMEDYSEIRYGRSLVDKHFLGHSAAMLWDALDSIHAGVSSEAKSLFQGWAEHTENETFIVCLTEHDAAEDQDGRLSMWKYRRAHGGTGYDVAVVVNPTSFLSPTNAIMSWSFPVLYGEDAVALASQDITRRIRDAAATLALQSRDQIRAHAFRMLIEVTVSSKHAGFREEREWRIVHLPKLWPSDRIKPKRARPNGEDEVIYELPLVNYEGEGLVGASIPELLDRVIIGPMDADRATKARRAICDVLERQVKLANGGSKVVTSSIPIRA